jgi:hypothetical protein
MIDLVEQLRTAEESDGDTFLDMVEAGLLRRCADALEAKNRIIASQRIVHERDAARIAELEVTALNWADSSLQKTERIAELEARSDGLTAVREIHDLEAEVERLRAALENLLEPAEDVAETFYIFSTPLTVRFETAIREGREALVAVDGEGDESK